MKGSMVDRIFVAMREIEANHGVPEEAPRRCQIGLFGGEPLLESNRPIVAYIVYKALDANDLWYLGVGQAR